MVENSKQSIIKLLRNNKELKKNDMKLLKKVSKKFPFFLPVKVLKLVLAKKHQTIDYNKILKSTSINITDMDDEAKKFPIITKVEKDVAVNSVMSNSFGFGGTNATLVFEKV